MEHQLHVCEVGRDCYFQSGYNYLKAEIAADQSLESHHLQKLKESK